MNKLFKKDETDYNKLIDFLLYADKDLQKRLLEIDFSEIIADNPNVDLYEEKFLEFNKLLDEISEEIDTKLNEEFKCFKDKKLYKIVQKREITDRTLFFGKVNFYGIKSLGKRDLTMSSLFFSQLLTRNPSAEAAYLNFYCYLMKENNLVDFNKRVRLALQFLLMSCDFNYELAIEAKEDILGKKKKSTK